MVACLHCEQKLTPQKIGRFHIDSCASCNSQLLTLAALKKLTSDELARSIWTLSLRQQQSSVHACPLCSQRMLEVYVSTNETEIDLCPHCQAVWLDRGEAQQLDLTDEHYSVEPFAFDPRLTPDAQKELALLGSEFLQQQHEQLKGNNPPDSLSQKILGYIGFPISLSYLKECTQPWISLTLAALIVLVYPFTFQNIEQYGLLFGIIPAQGFFASLARSFSASFIHSEAIHVIGNLYFLLVIGMRIEQQLSNKNFLILLCVSSMSTGLMLALSNSTETVPYIGSSGVLFGLLAYYIIQSPLARWSFVMWIGNRPFWYSLPTFILAIPWVFYTVIIQIYSHHALSAFAVLGGALGGLLCTYLLPRRENRS